MLNESHDPGPRRQTIAALVLLLLLVLGGWWLSRTLRAAAVIQDCVAAGRTNCAPVDAPAPR